MKKGRYRIKLNVLYKGRNYKQGDTIDLTEEDAQHFQGHMLEYVGDAASLDAGQTRINEHLTVLHAEAAMKKFRYVFITPVTCDGKDYAVGDTVDLTADQAAANPEPEVWVNLGPVEVLDARPNSVGPPQTVVDVQGLKKAAIAGSPSGQEQAAAALNLAETLCRAAGVPGPRRSARTAHFDEGLPACPVDPASSAFSERVKERVAQMRSWGRREPDHVLMGEAMKELRHSGVASSSF
jgi:hypothetical protein